MQSANLKKYSPLKPLTGKIAKLPKKANKKAQQKALNPGSYPKGDYRVGMPRTQMNLQKLRQKNKIITTLD
jgi:hypothetical protein